MRRPLLAVCLCLVTAAAVCRWAKDPPEGLPAGQDISVTGRIYQKSGESFYLEMQSVADVSQRQNSDTHLITNSPELPEGSRLICEYENAENELLGSIVALRGRFDDFGAATNPGEFDYQNYYSSLGITGRLREVEILGRGTDCSRLGEFLYALRSYWRSRLYSVFPEKEASVMTAILLGDKSNLDGDVKKLYQSNGVIHILSISGLHITVIGLGLYRLLRRMRMPVWAAALCGGAVLMLYGMMTGMSVSACRAIGMYLLRMLALLCGRTYDMLTAMGVMAAFLALRNPGYLGNMGFLLSFGSVMGVGMLCPALTPIREETAVKLQRYTEGRVKRFLEAACRKLRTGAGQGLAAGFSIILTTLPIQLWFSYEVPVWAGFLNILILPSMGVVMAAGLAAMLVPGLGFAGTVDILILAGYERLCALFEGLPFHTWNPGRPKVWQIVVYYGIWIAVVWGTDCYRRMRKNQDGGEDRRSSGIAASRRAALHNIAPRTIAFCKAAALALAVLILAVKLPTGDTVTFLDVGQGDCICVQLAGGEVYLFDCGSSSRSKIGERVLIPFLKYHGVSRVDAVFISHSDEDHVNGLLELFALGGEEHISVGQVVLPAVEETMRREEFGELLEASEGVAQKKEIAVGYVGAGDSLWASESSGRFLCLHPWEGFSGADANACSACFYMEFGGGFSLLLTGDVEKEGETALLEEMRRQGIESVSAMKVAHHGSKYSTPEELLEQAAPRMAVISCGRRNRYGHPHEETMERLANSGAVILRTDESGAVTVHADGERVWVETYNR